VFSTQLDQLHDWLFGPMDAAHGLPLAEIKTVEKRLRVQLPSPLRDFYSRLGNQREAMSAHLQMYHPSKLELARGHLAFCEEQQGEACYAVALGELGRLDPPVVQGVTGEEGWHTESRQLSVFLLKLLCWQGVNSLPCGATAAMSEEQLGDLATVVAPVVPTENDEGAFLAYADDGIAVCAFPHNAILYVAAVNDARLHQFGEELGIELQRL
jgi:hypothetical protein